MPAGARPCRGATRAWRRRFRRDHPWTQPAVALGQLDRRVSENALQRFQRTPMLEEPGCERVAQPMRGEIFHPRVTDDVAPNPRSCLAHCNYSPGGRGRALPPQPFGSPGVPCRVGTTLAGGQARQANPWHPVAQRRPAGATPHSQAPGRESGRRSPGVTVNFNALSRRQARVWSPGTRRANRGGRESSHRGATLASWRGN